MKILYKIDSITWWTEIITCNNIIVDCKGRFSKEDQSQKENILGENINSFLDRLKVWGYEYTLVTEIISIEEIVLVFKLLGKVIRLGNRKWSQNPYDKDSYFDWYTKEEYEEKIKAIDLEYKQNKIRKYCNHLNFEVEKFEDYPEQNVCLDCGLRFYERDRKDLIIKSEPITRVKNTFTLNI